jgi:TolB-like protein/Tfp pilus assembly protein PilF
LRLGLALAVVVVFLAVLLAVNRDRLGQWLGPGPPKIESLAVLPLENLTGNPEEDYFVDGVTDGLITHLAKLRRLRVISRTSAMSYKGTNKPLPAIARELNVDAVVSGAVMRSGDRVRINVQLLHPSSDRHLWAETYEGEIQDVWRFQGHVARAVADEIGLELTARERAQLVASHAVDPEAYAAFLRGRYFWNKRTVEAFRKAVEHFQQAVAHDPGFAPAHAGLADTYALLGVWSAIPMPEAKQKAEAAAHKALELDPTLAEAHTSVAFLMGLDCSAEEYPEAEKRYRRALALNPNYATAHHWYALYLSGRGRYDEALAEMGHARQLDPLSVIIQSDVGFVYYQARQYDQAILEYREALELDPTFEVAHGMLSGLYLKKGMEAEAVAEAEKAYAHTENAYTGGGLACVYERTGKPERAQEILKGIEKHRQRIVITSRLRAGFHKCMEDKEQTLAWLEKAFEEERATVCELNDPSYDFLRDDPRFQVLVRRHTPSL